jgi:hypothetical protein
MNYEDRLWRTLIRVVYCGKLYAYVVVPSWDSTVIIKISLNSIPKDISDQMGPDFRCHAHVNIGSTLKKNLRFESWEL